MECKFYLPGAGLSAGTELIDTLWNVNKIGGKNFDNFSHELIDTLWNVNVYLSPLSGVSIGINRYIMECKSF